MPERREAAAGSSGGINCWEFYSRHFLSDFTHLSVEPDLRIRSRSTLLRRLLLSSQSRACFDQLDNPTASAT